MATKRYQPSLTLIPEEGSPRSNTPSVYGSQMPTPSECQGCVTNRCSGHVKNCGDKRNSIEKWLEMVQSTEDNRASEENRPPGNQQNEAERQSPSSSSITSKSSEGVKTPNSIRSGTSGSKRIAPPKQKPPPPPVQQKSAVTHNPRNSSNQQRQEDEESHYGHNPSSLYQKSRNLPSLPALQQKLDAYSALTASAHMYGYAETGSEIYNNPKFTLHDSPAASQRSRGSSHRSRKRLDVLDHYAAASTPTSLSSTERAHYNMLRSMEQLNDHLDSGTLERMHQEYTATLRSNGSFNLDIPTPDYDSTMEKKIKDIYNNTQSSGPSVPTPDYSSLSRKSLKLYQPDSPIYRRKSPQYLIVDYETDSLERLEATKRKSSQSSSSPSSDVSSQLSPSLSTALPLEEELEISHTVYQGSGYNTKSLRSEKKNTIRTLDSGGLKKDVAARIKYDTPFRGSMTIEVEHEPPSDLERSTDSDQYEPDTLDRKPKKQSFCDVNPWTNMEMKRSFDNLSSPPQSLPDMSNRPATAKVESQNSFRLKPHGTPGSTACRRQISRDSAYESQVELRRPCGNEDLLEDPNTKVSNLRDIYQSLLVRQNSDCSCKCGGQATSMFLQEKIEDLSEKGRILTLEAKHTRRQRCSQPTTPPPMVEISNESSNKCTIKISTPKAGRVNVQADKRPTEYVEPRVHQKPAKEENPATAKYLNSPRQLRSLSETPPSRIKRSLSQSPQTPPPPPPPTSASTTLNSRTSRASSNTQHQSYRANSHTEEETMSNHSESTEVTGISSTMTNSEFGGTIDKKASPNHNHNKLNKSDKSLEKPKVENINSLKSSITPEKTEAQQTAKKLKEEDFGAIFNTHINGLRNDYSLNKYLNRRKSQERNEIPPNDSQDSSNQPLEMQMEHNNNLKFNNEADVNKLDVVSLSSRSNRSSSRLSDRTKEMYRNAGVPVGIAYPQRSNANNNNNSSSSAHNSNSNNPATPPSPPTNNVQTVYRCEIEPVQLTHGMQIAMGLKDRPKKAKDIKNAWKKFVSMAASKFSPTQSPAPPFDKKASSLLEVLERDEGISSLIEDHPQVSTPKSSYSAPASQNYYEQRFGPRTQELDSGYMSADSGEAYKRSFYDRYNFKMMSERDHIIRVSTIEDNSDGDSTLTDRHKGEEPSTRRGSILDATRFEDIEHINEQQLQQCLPVVSKVVEVNDDVSDNDSEKTLTRSNVQRRSPTQSTSSTTFTSDEEEEEPITTSYGSSETDGETNVDDMWESGAESVETHSVLYKNVRKSIER